MVLTIRLGMGDLMRLRKRPKTELSRCKIHRVEFFDEAISDLKGGLVSPLGGGVCFFQQAC
jgi:hypothetical protein